MLWLYVLNISNTRTNPKLLELIKEEIKGNLITKTGRLQMLQNRHPFKVGLCQIKTNHHLDYPLKPGACRYKGKAHQIAILVLPPEDLYDFSTFFLRRYLVLDDIVVLGLRQYCKDGAFFFGDPIGLDLRVYKLIKTRKKATDNKGCDR